MVGMALLAPRIIDLLYGSAFAPSQVSLIILSFDIPLLLLTAFCGNITAATGLEGPAARIYISSVLMNVVLNLIFIPKYGMLAASVITIITDFLSTAAFFVLLHRHMRIMEILPRLMTILLAAGLMGLGIWFAHPLPLFLLIALAGSGYIALVWRLGAIDQQALIKLRSLIPQRE